MTTAPVSGPPANPLARLSDLALVVFGASWCAPWTLLDPILTRLAEEGLDVRRVDIDTHDHLAETYRVICLPTICVMRAGKEARRVTGAVSEKELRTLTRARRR